MLWAFALHGLTHRWRLSVHDDGVVVVRGSWLWEDARVFAPDAMERLAHKLMYSAGRFGGEMVEHRALFVQPMQGAPGRSHRLTPALAGTETAERVAHHLRRAVAHRRGRFAPGEVRARAWSERVGARALQRVSGWALWAGGLALALSVFGRMAAM